MADFLRLLFLVPLGYIAAVIAAALTILAGWYGHDAGAISSDVVATGAVIGIGFWVVVEVGALAAVPALIAIVLAELFRWRSVFFYLAVGGGLGLLATPLHGTDGSQLLLPAAGSVGGFAYWFIAGRLAGVAAPPGEPPADPAV